MRGGGWLLIKRGLYWRPEAMGYTGRKDQAGIYSDAESSARVRVRGEWDDVTRIAVSDAPDLSPSCSVESAAEFPALSLASGGAK